MAILKIILIVVFLIAALAVTVIVLSQEGKSAGLGSLSGQVSGGNSYWDKNRKYSLEGKLEKWTKISATVFIVAALGLMLIQGKGSNAGNTTISTDTPSATVTTDTPTDEASENADAAATNDAAPAEQDATNTQNASDNAADGTQDAAN